MSLIPILRPQVILRALGRAGFRIIHSRGSHFRLEHTVTKRRVTVSFHPGDVPKKTLLSILRQAGLTLDEFFRYLGKHMR